MPASESKIAEVASSLKLSTATFGAWLARRLHREESDKVNLAHNTKRAAKVSVLQCEHPSLSEIYRIQGAARAKHYDMTMPSCQDGMRLVARGNEFQHAAVMQNFAEEQSKHVEILAEALADEYHAAMKRLNGLFDPRAWPKSPSELREKFTFKVRYLACPTGGAWSDWLSETIEVAEAEIQTRLRDALERVVDRVLDVKNNGKFGRLHQTVFSNLRELTDLVPDFDFDGKYAEIVALSKEVAKYDAEEVREDKATRESIAKRASSILEILGQKS